MIAIKFILIVFLILISYVIGYIFTETKFYLAQFDIFKFKAFECRPCFTFHVSWVLQTFIALLFNDWIMLIVGVVFSFILYLGLYIDQKKRFV